MGSRAEAKARKESFILDLKVGDILVGYDQGYDCMCFFYEIISKSGSTLIMRELNQDVRETGFKPYSNEMTGIAIPERSYRGEPIKRVVRSSSGVKITDNLKVALWDGQEKYVTWYGKPPTKIT